jgi:hypothetical protein
MNVPAPRPAIPFQVIQQCQEFLLQLAWQEVRTRETMAVAQQKTLLLECYNRFAELFLQNAIPACNPSYPICPEALRNYNRPAAVAILNQLTNTGRASISKESMYRRAKKGVQKLLKYMGDWVRICKDPGTRTGEFTPSAPPSGKDRDYVWNKIKSTEHRAKECLRIWKSRTSNSHLAENTADAIRESLTHLNFARRGFSLEDEMCFRGDFEAHTLEEDDINVYNQIMEEVIAGNVLPDSDDDETVSVSSRSSVATPVAPRGYHEAPYSEITGNYHPFELAFKAFTQYAGHGHADIDAFYTNEWADHQRTQASSGATGRAQQRRQQATDWQQTSANSSATSRDDTSSQSTITTLATTATSQIDELSRQMQLANDLARRSLHISSLEKAITLAKSTHRPQADVTRLQDKLFAVLLHFEDDENAQPPTASRITAPAPLTTALSSARPPQRRRTFTDEQTEAIEQIEQEFHVQENIGEGNCLFYALEDIEIEFMELCNRRSRDPITHAA